MAADWGRPVSSNSNYDGGRGQRNLGRERERERIDSCHKRITFSAFAGGCFNNLYGGSICENIFQVYGIMKLFKPNYCSCPGPNMFSCLLRRGQISPKSSCDTIRIQVSMTRTLRTRSGAVDAVDSARNQAARVWVVGVDLCDALCY